MLSFNQKYNKKWFTLVETMLVCWIFAIMVVWIIAAINRAYIFMNNTRLQVRATNYAREWIEMMFNIRNTNRRMGAGKKDKCRLVSDIVKHSSCEDWSRFKPWLYTLEKWKNESWDMYFYANKLNNINSQTEIETYYSDDGFREKLSSNPDDIMWSKIVFTGTYSIIERSYEEWKWWTWEFTMWNKIQDLLWDGVEFYRLLRVYGIYDKTNNSSSESLDRGIDTERIWWALAKEIRFCVKTFYKSSGWEHSVELCSLMTNFEE